MGSDQSKPSSLPLSSSDEAPLFSKDLFSDHRDRLSRILLELQQVQASFRDFVEKALRRKRAGELVFVVGAVVALGVLTAPLTGGHSLIVAGAGLATEIAGSTAVFEVAATLKVDMEEAKRRVKALMEEFVWTLESLGEELLKLEGGCTSMTLSDQYGLHRRLKLMELELKRLGVRSQIVSLSESEDDFERILSELDKVCTQICTHRSNILSSLLVCQTPFHCPVLPTAAPPHSQPYTTPPPADPQGCN